VIPKQVIDILSAEHIILGDPAPINAGGYFYFVSARQACGSNEDIAIRLLDDIFLSLAR
jgi:hypothetical protein